MVYLLTMGWKNELRRTMEYRIRGKIFLQKFFDTVDHTRCGIINNSLADKICVLYSRGCEFRFGFDSNRNAIYLHHIHFYNISKHISWCTSICFTSGDVSEVRDLLCNVYFEIVIKFIVIRNTEVTLGSRR